MLTKSKSAPCLLETTLINYNLKLNLKLNFKHKYLYIF